MGDLIGQSMGSYRLTRLLGRGGFAEVYLGSQAAVKVLPIQADQEQRELILKEARTSGRLDHPHIARMLELSACGKRNSPNHGRQPPCCSPPGNPSREKMAEKELSAQKRQNFLWYARSRTLTRPLLASPAGLSGESRSSSRSKWPPRSAEKRGGSDRPMHAGEGAVFLHCALSW